jgi:broad specificity phosphatase PhoE
MMRFFIILIFAVSFQQFKCHASSKIYFIRHARVDLKKPGWQNSKNAALYKEEYNRTDIKPFNPERVWEKIEFFENIDAAFCSPQLRVIQTASVLFHNGVILNIDSALVELDYPVVKIPVVQIPAKGWLLVSNVTWRAGINPGNKISYRKRKEELEIFSGELADFAARNGSAVVVAHGMVNRELVKIMKDKGWHFCPSNRNRHKNLSVNCLEYICNE